MTVQTNKSCLDFFRCWCCKKKEIPPKTPSQMRVEVAALSQLSEPRHERLNSGENISLAQALAWNGRYTFRDLGNQDSPITITIPNTHADKKHDPL